MQRRQKSPAANPSPASTRAGEVVVAISPCEITSYQRPTASNAAASSTQSLKWSLAPEIQLGTSMEPHS
ncbi:hypothetical protein [Stieleria varia]|uniref:hypothetical protein n=1 Tax=Stieleria varia TaxID=2528005 RepID=UPI0011B56488|nr:hypothetical protein [Stieleria varia]